VQGYFEILLNTLFASLLPASRPRAKVKEIQHPKFYFFDPGVVRALSGRFIRALTGCCAVLLNAQNSPCLERPVKLGEPRR